MGQVEKSIIKSGLKFRDKKMKRPQESTDSVSAGFGDYQSGYNAACSDWEKFLPNKAKIKRLIEIYLGDPDQPNKYKKEFNSLAKAISGRINETNE